MKPLKLVDKDAGLLVWKSWLFDLPVLSFDTSIEVIEKQRELSGLEAELEKAKNKVVLEVTNEVVEGKPRYSNQAGRDAEALIRLSYNVFYKENKARSEELSEEIEKLKAQRKYYDDIFKTVKDEVYYQHRTEELKQIRDLAKQKSDRLKELIDNGASFDGQI